MTHRIWLVACVATIALVVGRESLRAEHEGKLQILLLGDSTTEGSVPRRHVPKGPHLEDVIRELLAEEKGLPPMTLDIDFTAPRFDSSGKKASKAVISVKLNEHQTVGKLEVNGPTPHGFKGPETPDGPIWFEAFGRRVLYRNIWVVERL